MQHHPTGTEPVRTVDWVVCAVQQQPDDELWHHLRDAPFPVHRVGDCLAPRRAHAAVIEVAWLGALIPELPELMTSPPEVVTWVSPEP